MEQENTQGQEGRRTSFFASVLIVMLVVFGAIKVYGYFQSDTNILPAGQENFIDRGSITSTRESLSPTTPIMEQEISEKTLEYDHTATFAPVSEILGSGKMYYQLHKGNSTYSIRVDLPDITQAYEYAAWLQSEDENIFHRLGQLKKSLMGDYTLETSIQQDENVYTRAIITVEFIFASSTPGMQILEAKLAEQ